MGNKQLALFGRLASEWKVRQYEGITYYKNVITKQEFQLQQLVNCSNNDLQNYLQRSIYPLPNTPKIMILDHLEQKINTLILVQKPNQKAKNFIPKLIYQLQILESILQCSRAAESLFRRYGDYCLNESMLGFDTKGNILVWFNQNYKQNKPEILIQGAQKNKERALIMQIKHIYQKYCRYDLNDLLLIPLPNSFTEFQIKLQHLISKQKEKLTNVKNYEAKQQNYNSRPVSPKHYLQTDTFKSPRKNKTPKFITQLKKNITNQKSSQLLTTKIPRLLKNKQQFLNFNFQKDNSQKLASSRKMKNIMEETLQFSDMRILRQDAQLARESNNYSLTQTLPRNKITSNCHLDDRKKFQNSSPFKKTNRDGCQPQPKSKKAKPVALIQLCQKFKESRYIQELVDCFQDNSIVLNQKVSYTFDESRPMTFKHVSMKKQILPNWQDQIAQVIN